MTSNGQGPVLSVCLGAADLEDGSNAVYFPEVCQLYFIQTLENICSELSLQATCLTFCISVAVSVIKGKENKMQSNSGS